MRGTTGIVLASAAFASVLGACGPGAEADSPKVSLELKWIERSKESYAKADLDDALQAAQEARRVNPKSEPARLLAGRAALAKLDYVDVLKSLSGVRTTEAAAMRGRAYWYSGDLAAAADELDEVLRDPQVKDPWAREVTKLARRGTGRRPFTIDGGLVAAVEMPPAGSIMVVPCELEGERILALVATGVTELTLDSTTRKDSAWVSMRFGDRIEVHDIPAFTEDLSALSKTLGAPIKALLGVNLLRHLHVTLDRRAGQFVVRRDEPAAPPEASRVPVIYARGGGMLVRGGIAKRTDSNSTLVLDSKIPYSLALTDEIWKATGVDMASLKGDPQLPPGQKAGVIPAIRFAGIDGFPVLAVQGVELGELRARYDMPVDGVAGAGLLQPFRVTFGDGGRFLWFEPGPPAYQDEPEPAAPPSNVDLRLPGTPAAPAPKPGAPNTSTAKPPAAPPAPPANAGRR